MKAQLLFLFVACITFYTRADSLDTLSENTGLSGSFVQRIFGEDGLELEFSRGFFKFLKPHSFYWRVNTPDSQLILLVEDHLIQIDWDLEVVVERKVSFSERSPFLWLIAPRSVLEKHFDILSLGGSVSLNPRKSNNEFKRITVEQTQQAEWLIEIIDPLGHTIQIQLMPDFGAIPEDFEFNKPNVDFEGN